MLFSEKMGAISYSGDTLSNVNYYTQSVTAAAVIRFSDQVYHLFRDPVCEFASYRPCTSAANTRGTLGATAPLFIQN